MIKNELLTLPEVASILRISNSTVYKLIHDVDLPAMKVANKWRINVEQLEAWLRSKNQCSLN
jgi:excisionase family DNA binding protein